MHIELNEKIIFSWKRDFGTREFFLRDTRANIFRWNKMKMKMNQNESDTIECVIELIVELGFVHTKLYDICMCISQLTA